MTVLTLNRETLAAILTRACLIVKDKTTTPVIQHAKLERSTAGMTLTTTDFDSAITQAVEDANDTGEPFVALLPAKRLLAIVSQLPPGDVTLNIDGVKIRVTAGQSRFDVTGFRADEYPNTPTAHSVQRLHVDGKLFTAALNHTVACVSSELTLQPVAGVLLEARAEGLFLVGTDRHHLLRERIGEAHKAIGQWIIAPASVAVIRKLFEAEDGLAIEGDTTRLCFASDTVSLDLRLVEGPFPKHDMLLSQKTTSEATVDRMELVTAIKRVGALSPGARIALTWGTQLTVRASDADVGQAEDVVGCTFEGEPFVVGFNPVLLLHLLTALASDAVSLKMGGPIGATLVTPVGDTNSVGLVMPVRLTSDPEPLSE